MSILCKIIIVVLKIFFIGYILKFMYLLHSKKIGFFIAFIRLILFTKSYINFLWQSIIFYINFFNFLGGVKLCVLPSLFMV